MDIFFSDLDNTLIYSHRRNITGGRVLAERLDGREQSYMTERTAAFLRGADWLSLIPVTTRTPAQYLRIFGLDGLAYRGMALVCGGGALLRDGKEDPAWRSETMRLASSELGEVERAAREIADILGEENTRRVEPFFVYAPDASGGEAERRLRETVDPRLVSVVSTWGKIYAVARSAGKGTALERMASALGAGTTIAAGDGELDRPMLEAADVAMAPRALAESLGKPGAIAIDGDIISDRICDELALLRDRGLFR